MVVEFNERASEQQRRQVAEAAQAQGFSTHALRRAGRAALAVVAPLGGMASRARPDWAALRSALNAMAGVQMACLLPAGPVLVSREAQDEPSPIEVDGVVVGGNAVVVMAGPCAVEDETQIFACAQAARAGGATFLRGGAFKPRTSPYEFQGLGEEGLQLLEAAGRAHGLRVVTEVVSPADVPLVARHAQVLQVGARNMQNFELLKAVGAQARPVLLKRGLCATYREWLLAAEYIAAHGNKQIMLCERGIRSFESSTRNTLDVAAVPALRALTHLPILIDPSHATGRRDLVAACARAGIAAGADGILVEMHPNPSAALSDGPQSLDFAAFAALTQSLSRVAHAVDRSLRPGDAHVSHSA